MALKSLAVFYHIWSPARSDMWRLLLDEQLKRMQRAGLPMHSDIFCCISGPQHAEIRGFLAEWDWVNILANTPDESRYEGETLARLHDACTQRDDLVGVAYVHMKGIRHLPTAAGNFRAINSWRHFMEWGTIDRWRDAVCQLGTNDLTGVNFKSDPWPHYSGNFWWARPDYIRRLARPDPISMALTGVGIDADAATLDRVAYERWVGTGSPRVFSFYDFPYRIPGRDRNFGFDLYLDDIFPIYEQLGR